MSYILDALKKLDHEKSKKSRGIGKINISGALFENERPEAAGPAGWKIALVIMVAVLVTFTATWYFFQSGKGREGALPRREVAVPQAAPVRIASAPAPAVPMVAPVPHALPAAQTAARPASPSLDQEAKKQSPAPVPAPVDAAAFRLTKQELGKRLKKREVQTSSAAPLIAAPADIKLSGIAYQDERRARRAVVNGFLMQEGGVVSGAVITDILQDRVRFTRSGRSFELSLLPSEAPGSGR
ncbi:MAG: hypothetical protein M0T70_17485 [Geobacteraceae bacterium]|nr:hypothetical protein [Geobacteraceae bacterium]